MFKFLKNLVMSLFKEPLAGASFVLAAVGGLAATGCWVGSWIVFAVHIGPWWLPFPLAGIGLLMIIGDLGRDGIPERLAIYLAILWPSFVMAIPKQAKAHEKLTGWITDMNHWLDTWLTEWIGKPGTNALMTVVAVTCIAMAVVYAERYAKNTATLKANAGTGGTTTGTTTPVATRRGRR